MKVKATWSEWVYCGVGDDMKEDVISRPVSDYLQDPILFHILNRKESKEVGKKIALEKIKVELEIEDILLCNSNFKKAIWFNRIGVMRYGIVPIGK